jgi:hypothetical protein
LKNKEQESGYVFSNTDGKLTPEQRKRLRKLPSYPDKFNDHSDAVPVTDDEIRERIEKCLYKVKYEDHERYSISSGDTKVEVMKMYPQNYIEIEVLKAFKSYVIL